MESVKEIADHVRRENVIQQGEIEPMDVDSDQEEAEGPDSTMGLSEMMELCAKLEKVSLKSTASCSLKVVQTLRRSRAKLSRESFLNAKQATLDSYFKK